MRERVPKLCGADVEVGNFILAASGPDGTGPEASRALLREIGTVTAAVREPLTTTGSRFGAPADPQDWGRTYLPSNGGCAYIDLDHLELCLPEVLSAYDHVACWHAMLRIAQRALAAANDRRPGERRITVLVNNSDGHGHSYGSHLNFLLTRRAWNELVHRKLHHQAYLAAFQVSSVVLTGQGKVGSENGAPAVDFQIAQRADFIETLTGIQTTYQRPLINTRDEPLGDTGARLHVIFFDSTLCQVATLLKVGTMQIVLAMIEQGAVDPELALDDPLAALGRWSRDPTLEATARLVSGAEVTAVELQLRFLEEAERFVAAGGCDGLVPRAADIVALWQDTLQKLRRREWAALARCLDWVLKLSLIGRALETNRDLTWQSAAVKHLDHVYASLDPDEGLYWRLATDGFVEPVVPEEEIARFTREPPSDTRAWGRAMLLHGAGPDAVDEVDWDHVTLRLRDSGGRTNRWRVDLADPLRATRDELQPVFERAQRLDDLLTALGATRDEARWTVAGCTCPRCRGREPDTTPLLRRSVVRRGGLLKPRRPFGRRRPENGDEHETA